MKKNSKKNSFIIVDNNDEIKIIIDEETGVNYLFYGDCGNNCGGLTIRINENGKPYITKNVNKLNNNVEIKYFENDK